MERESWRFPLWNYDYQRDCRSQVCSIYQTLSAPFFPGCLWMLLVKQPATTPSVLPQTVPSVPHLSLPLVSESLPSLHVISVQQSSDSSGLFQTSFAVSTRHTVPCDPRKSCDPLCFGSHKWHLRLFLGLHGSDLMDQMDLHVLSVSFSPDAFALLRSSLSSSQSAFIMHLMNRYLF